MRGFSVFSCLFVLAAFAPVQARADVSAEDTVKLSSNAAVVAAWNFANCAVKRDRAGVSAVLDLMRTSPGVEMDREALEREMRELAGKYGGCLAPGDKLTGKMATFTNVLGGAVFVDKYKNVPLPDYSKVPWLYTADSVERAESREKPAKLFRLFAECVFRVQPKDVQALLRARPFSSSEAAALVKLQPTLGSCLPAREGTQLKLSKGSVRNYLAMAAYLVDQVYEWTKPKKASQMAREQGRRYA